MRKRLFFLKQDGWCEAELEINLHHASYDELIRLAYVMMARYCYRNYMITENPDFAVKGQVQNRVMDHVS